MPAPATLVDFLELAAKSQVLERRQIDTFVHQIAGQPDQPSTPKQLAQMMVRDGLLTHLQAGLILRGKYKNFFISGKYMLMEHLGTGGMGSVYLCEHVMMRRRVALKVLPTDRVHDPVVLERFFREARAVAAVDHRNIVRAYDIDRDGDMHFLVLEYVDGSSLQHIIEKFGPMHTDRAVNCIRQAADGLQHAHECGLVHRDIKPGNLLLDRMGTIKILDLGLARFFNDDSGPISHHDGGNANVIGTADYVAPEQAIDSTAVDIRGDIYSLGVTLYFLLTGRSPYKDGSVSQKLMWHQISQPTPINEYRPDVPRKLAAVIEKMLEKDPAQRFQTPEELYLALEPWDQGAMMPPDEEMPRLCAAVMAGGQSTGRLPPLTRILPASDYRPRPGSGGLMSNPKIRNALLVGFIVLCALTGAAAAVFSGR
jgi:eukaryotic-like serine/threonine-protein kinase